MTNILDEKKSKVLFFIEISYNIKEKRKGFQNE